MDIVRRHTKLNSKGLHRDYSRFVKPSYLGDLFSRQFGVGVTFPSRGAFRVQSPPMSLPTCGSFWMCSVPVAFATRPTFRVDDHPVSIPRRLAVLRYHVCRIISGRAQEKMIRIAARWIVTLMTNKHIVRYGAMRKFIGNSVRLDAFASEKCPSAMPRLLTRELPGPTCVHISDMDMTPKAFGECYTHSTDSSNQGLVAPRPFAAALGILVPNYSTSIGAI